MKIFIAGDFVPQNRVAKLFHNKQYGEVLDEVKDVVSNADYSLVNLEAPVVISPNCEKIQMIGPCLSTDLSAIEALKYAGIKAVTLANNHIRDYGDWGVSDTLLYLTKEGLETVGAGLDEDEAKSFILKNIQGRVISVINCCEHEFSIAGIGKAGANSLDPVKQYYAIQQAKKLSDYVIVIVHGGVEQYNYPTPRMIETYRYFIDAGADVVINHHQHCFSGYELYHSKPIFYGLGNFCFDKGYQVDTPWTKGYALMLNLENGIIEFEILPYRQCAENPTVTFLEGEDKVKFFDELERINQSVSGCELHEKYEDFMKRNDKEVKAIFSPYSNRYLTSMYVRGWLPGFMSKKRSLALQSKVECESHRERLLQMLKIKNDNLA